MNSKNVAFAAIALFPLSLLAGVGSDGFTGLHCGDDIAQALIGKKMSNETVVALEKRHQDLGLKDLGADEISDRLNCISWLICGKEYLILEDGDRVSDVIQIPAHSKKTPEFLGITELNDKKTKATIVAILDNESESGAPTLPAKVAWKIDEKKGKFVTLPAEGLRCPRNGIITTDGGL